MMGCMIFYKKCQEVDTVTSQILISTPNTIKEDIIKQTMDNKLKAIEDNLLLTDKNYKRQGSSPRIRLGMRWLRTSRRGCHGKDWTKRNKNKAQATRS